MTNAEREFGELLNTIPLLGSGSGQPVVDAFRADTKWQEMSREHNQVVFISPGFFVMVPIGDRSSVIITRRDLAARDYPALAELARNYASDHGVSLELYYFSDIRSGMFAFGTLDSDTEQFESVYYDRPYLGDVAQPASCTRLPSF